MAPRSWPIVALVAVALGAAHGLLWKGVAGADPRDAALLEVLRQAPVADLAHPVAGPAIYQGTIYAPLELLAPMSGEHQSPSSYVHRVMCSEAPTRPTAFFLAEGRVVPVEAFDDTPWLESEPLDDMWHVANDAGLIVHGARRGRLPNPVSDSPYCQGEWDTHYAHASVIACFDGGALRRCRGPIGAVITRDGVKWLRKALVSRAAWDADMLGLQAGLVTLVLVASSLIAVWKLTPRRLVISPRMGP